MCNIVQYVLSLFTSDVQKDSSSPIDDSDPLQVPADTTSPATATAQECDHPSLATLRTRVSHILTIFDDPRYAHLDIPNWVHRAAPLAHHARVTVRGLIRAMCNSAAELGLADSERYVLETVCSCATGDVDGTRLPATPETHVEQAETQAMGEEGAEALAWRLQHLASAWSAFLFWPFYARMADHESFARGHASPCTGLSHAQKAMAFGEFDPDECLLRSSYPLRDQVLARDGQRCVVSGVWDRKSRVPAPPGTRWSQVDTVRIFKHPLVVYKDVYDHDKAKRDSVLLSLDVLQRFCELDKRYTDVELGSAGIMDDPANLLSLCCNAHIKFDAFGLCFVPTQCAHTYKLADRDPDFPSLPLSFPSTSTLPRTVTFQDLTTPTSSAAQKHGSLPSRDLLRAHAALGSVLYANNAALASVFERIEEPIAIERPPVCELPIPDPDGVSFWRDLVIPGVGEERLCDGRPGPGPDEDALAQMLGVASPPA